MTEKGQQLPPIIDTLSWIKKCHKENGEVHQRIVEDLEASEVQKAKQIRMMNASNHSSRTRTTSTNENGTSTSSSSNDDRNPSKQTTTTNTSLKKDLSSPSVTTMEPINIFCIDGGGSKGYAMQAMVEVLENLCKESYDDGDFISRFDLVAGTSVGGIAALVCSQTNNMNDFMTKSREYLDLTTKTVFTDFCHRRLLITGSGMKDSNDIRSISKMLYGEKALFENHSRIKCFAVCTTTSCDVSNNSNIEDKMIQPLLLRSYTHPLEDDKNAEQGDLKKPPYYQDGTSNLKVWEAMAATSAAPGAFKRVQVEINGESKLLLDGGLCCNCPVAIAIKEAQSLWPNRPIGTVLSVGVDPTQDALAQAAVDSTRLNHPGLYYQRIIVPGINDICGFLETDRKKIAEAEDLVRDYMAKPIVRKRLSLVLDMLFEGPNRRLEDRDIWFDDIDDDTSNGRKLSLLSRYFVKRTGHNLTLMKKSTNDNDAIKEQSLMKEHHILDGTTSKVSESPQSHDTNESKEDRDQWVDGYIENDWNLPYLFCCCFRKHTSFLSTTNNKKKNRKNSSTEKVLNKEKNIIGVIDSDSQKKSVFPEAVNPSLETNNVGA